MERYRNLNGDSGVSAYELGMAFIKVWFADGSAYLYTAASAGAHNIAQMQILARSGAGLNEFINRYVRTLYESKSR